MAGKRQLGLFGENVKRLKTESVEDGALIKALNSSTACVSWSDDDRQWVRKRVLHTQRPALLAEILGWLLSVELDVPVPDGAVTGEGEDLSWLSEVLPYAQHWMPARYKYVQNLDDLGRMLALDAIIFNPDRHERNILVTTSSSDLELRVWSIDLGESLLGQPRRLAAAGLTLPELEVVPEQLPLPLIRDGATAAAGAAELITKSLLKSFVDEACHIVGERRSEELLGALWHRTRHAQRLVAEYLRKLETAQ
ncbi:hypothetical protein CYFUS_001678 [Cystobacter fuscus]|uniref:PI3K/PI4K catalytic domain-containing protein n=1 Tax=Cystobacter fuscus TaxID=43 RepID=A0A250IX13_9BACT|nr:hypothetical protein CYFUS_001678 [Cystobacter fuscus]